jgi:hypothetical protein
MQALSERVGAGLPLTVASLPVWLCGTAAFALALYALLSWRPAAVGRGAEDAPA